ncbi:hypothetical protein AAFF_G00435140 [Aldrovandia affinis]|uniref:Cell growth-regulating nucleolar protein n=1 Tax=Aldrovandia affinis TaxID=143900 RepID=A0AAD7S8B4_9TELE|nr:hypothetical protein AAFF_G00435140 [Aldrovandia affinis]
MVFFTCNACGESLKKAQVEKHVNICRGCEILSCIDCGKDFWGDDYKNHIKCISENQKYGGKGYPERLNSNKGLTKQSRIQEAMNKPGISAKLRDVLSQVSSYDNAPRKKAKFQNWMRNSLKIHNTCLHDQVWEIFAQATSDAPAAPKQGGPTQPAQSPLEPDASAQAEQNGGQEVPPKEKKKNKRERKEERQKKGKKKRGAENGDAVEQGEGEGEDGGEKPRKKKKRKRAGEETPVGNGAGGTENGHSLEGETASKRAKKRKRGTSEDDKAAVEAEQNTEDAVECESNPKGKFNWKGTIKAVLKQAPEEGFPVKKLRKKVLAEYYSFSGDRNHKSEEELLALFNKKVNSNPKFRVLKEKVRLIK